MYKLTQNIIPFNIYICIDKENNFELVYICFIRRKSLLIVLDPVLFSIYVQINSKYNLIFILHLYRIR